MNFYKVFKQDIILLQQTYKTKTKWGKKQQNMLQDQVANQAAARKILY